MPYGEPSVVDRNDAITRLRRARTDSEHLASVLSPEDWMLQSMPEASPVKWNLAHTSWFFETFILKEYFDGYREFNPAFGYLYNSYYRGVGDMHPRGARGDVSRPSAQDVLAYRAHVDSALFDFIDTAREEVFEKFTSLICLGIAHEEQHQELMLTDIKHAMASNPISPELYPFPDQRTAPNEPQALAWRQYREGLVTIGADPQKFHYDNEGPQHQVFLEAFEIANRAVTNGEYAEFIRDGGYRDSKLWFSDGWDFVREHDIQRPNYWRGDGEDWREYTVFGERDIDAHAPACHISFYEAAAYAAWAGARLPTEFEWERASADAINDGAFLKEGSPCVPAPAAAGEGISQMFGDVWEWTASPYIAYPRYVPAAGAVGEYNGKFMSGQMVLRGGSCATPAGHIRPSYRNFFQPTARWQFSGVRLARDCT